jgi:hypothetical protein
VRGHANPRVRQDRQSAPPLAEITSQIFEYPASSFNYDNAPWVWLRRLLRVSYAMGQAMELAPICTSGRPTSAPSTVAPPAWQGPARVMRSVFRASSRGFRPVAAWTSVPTRGSLGPQLQTHQVHERRAPHFGIHQRPPGARQRRHRRCGGTGRMEPINQTRTRSDRQCGGDLWKSSHCRSRHGCPMQLQSRVNQWCMLALDHADPTLAEDPLRRVPRHRSILAAQRQSVTQEFAVRSPSCNQPMVVRSASCASV